MAPLFNGLSLIRIHTSEGLEKRILCSSFKEAGHMEAWHRGVDREMNDSIETLSTSVYQPTATLTVGSEAVDRNDPRKAYHPHQYRKTVIFQDHAKEHSRSLRNQKPDERRTPAGAASKATSDLRSRGIAVVYTVEGHFITIEVQYSKILHIHIYILARESLSLLGINDSIQTLKTYCLST